VGRYHDAFDRRDGAWRFVVRDYSLLDLIGDLSHHNPSQRPTGAAPTAETGAGNGGTADGRLGPFAAHLCFQSLNVQVGPFANQIAAIELEDGKGRVV
jgi:hypothetical protein